MTRRSCDEDLVTEIHVIETAAKVVFAAVGNRASRRVVYLFVFSVFR